jgi:tetratricopeptide (TPR) repeat protein
MDERRRHPRYTRVIPVEVKDREGGQQLVTANISQGGVFVVTDSPRPELELVQLFFRFPARDEAVERMGIVTRRVTPSPQMTDKPGMAVELLELPADDLEQWERLVSSMPEEQEPVVDPVRRRRPRYTGRFRVCVTGEAQPLKAQTRDISSAGVFLTPPPSQPVGSKVELVLVHPRSGKEFAQTGRVVRVVEEPEGEGSGAGIAFDPLPPEREATLEKFIKTGVEYLDQRDGAWAERIRTIRQVAQAMRHTPLGLVRLGDVLLRESEVDVAIDAYNRALQLDPCCLPAHRGLYRAYTALEDTQRAREHLEALRRLERK